MFGNRSFSVHGPYNMYFTTLDDAATFIIKSVYIRTRVVWPESHELSITNSQRNGTYVSMRYFFYRPYLITQLVILYQ